MSLERELRDIRERYGSEFMLRMLAEECSELAQACLKEIRANRRETPVTPEDARKKLIEEMADAMLMWKGVRELLSKKEVDQIYEIERYKRYRMYDRMMYGGDGSGYTRDT